MTITLPRLRFLAPLFAASVFCASALGGYFSSGSAGVLTACFLLFLLTAAVRPTRREWCTGAIPAALLAFILGGLIDVLQKHVVPKGLRKGEKEQ